MLQNRNLIFSPIHHLILINHRYYYNTMSIDVAQLFSDFRTQLDNYHEQRERVIKASRDITASSKKVIFALQRIDADDTDKLHNDPHVSKNLKDIKDRIKSVKEDVTGDVNQWRYHKQFTGCIQEWIEAVSFQHYLEHRTVIKHEELSNTLPEVLITRGDYVLGIMDLTGELMRYAISHLSDTKSDSNTRGVSKIAMQIVNTMRQFKSELALLDINQAEKTLQMKELGKKVSVFEASLGKVEQAIYSLLVRGIEVSTLI